MWLNNPEGGVRADFTDADLSDADLSGLELPCANFQGAVLDRTNFTEAILRGADFRLADLSGADFRGADLSRATLRWADLSYATLRRADLSGANLRDANLRDANLRDADLRSADLRRADLRGADFTDAKLDYEIQPGLLENMACHAMASHDSLQMRTWHTCETTHCIAGWACHLNDRARELEQSHGTEIAGLLTLGAEAHSHFFDSNEQAREWLRSVLERSETNGTN